MPLFILRFPLIHCFLIQLNEIKLYMHAHNVPEQLQKRVIKWFDYLWMEKNDLHDEDTFKWLPEKCKADLLLHVNLDTLKKVRTFEQNNYKGA